MFELNPAFRRLDEVMLHDWVTEYGKKSVESQKEQKEGWQGKVDLQVIQHMEKLENYL